MTTIDNDDNNNENNNNEIVVACTVHDVPCTNLPVACTRGHNEPR